jgi:tRNA nucleotidyltransferase (CCA-adding enzyme)
MIKSFLSAKGKIMIDPENYYKKQNLMIEINESKTHSPIILVDPTFKERNVLAALSEESFEKTKEAIRQFLARPSAIYFETKPINESDLIKKANHSKAEYIKVILSTDKQEGDIAGTKLKKFSKYLISEIKQYFDIIEDEFDYKMTKEASLYLIVKSKKEIIKQGPPIRKDMQKHIEAFKKQNKKHFVKNGNLYAKIKIDFSAKEFISEFAKNNKKKIAEMDISSLKVNA